MVRVGEVSITKLYRWRSLLSHLVIDEDEGENWTYNYLGINMH